MDGVTTRDIAKGQDVAWTGQGARPHLADEVVPDAEQLGLGEQEGSAELHEQMHTRELVGKTTRHLVSRDKRYCCWNVSRQPTSLLRKGWPSVSCTGISFV